MTVYLEKEVMEVNDAWVDNLRDRKNVIRVRNDLRELRDFVSTIPD